MASPKLASLLRQRVERAHARRREHAEETEAERVDDEGVAVPRARVARRSASDRAAAPAPAPSHGTAPPGARRHRLDRGERGGHGAASIAGRAERRHAEDRLGTRRGYPRAQVARRARPPARSAGAGDAVGLARTASHQGGRAKSPSASSRRRAACANASA